MANVTFYQYSSIGGPDASKLQSTDDDSKVDIDHLDVVNFNGNTTTLDFDITKEIDDGGETDIFLSSGVANGEVVGPGDRVEYNMVLLGQDASNPDLFYRIDIFSLGDSFSIFDVNGSDDNNVFLVSNAWSSSAQAYVDPPLLYAGQNLTIIDPDNGQLAGGSFGGDSNNLSNAEEDFLQLENSYSSANPEWDDNDGRAIEDLVTCFVRGATLVTDKGPAPVEDLQIGDMVLTRDSGFKSICWIGSQKVAGKGKFSPIKFEKDALGNSEELWLSPQHRVLFHGAEVEYHFGQFEIIAPAISITNGDTICQCDVDEVEYFHVMFDQHELILSNGIWTESFFPGEFTMTSMEKKTRREIYDLFPELKEELSAYGGTVRPVVKGSEVALLTL